MKNCIVLSILLLSFFQIGYAAPPKYQSPTNPWTFSLGLAQITVPRYQGASAYRWFVVPNFDLKYKQFFFINAYQGIGLNVLNTKSFTAGASIRYNFGGNDERSKRFSGLENVKDLYQSGVFFSYKLGLLNFSINNYRAIGALKGSGYYNPNIGLFLPLSKTYLFRFSLGARYDDAHYMQSVFGINAEEAKDTGLTQYYPCAGWQSLNFSIIPIIKLTPKWNLSLVLSAKHFLPKAKKSPLIDHSTTYFSGITLMYKYA